MVLSIPILTMAAGAVVLAQTGETPQWSPAKRITLAITYPENETSTVDMAGTGLHSNVTGRVEAKRSNGQTHLKARINNLQHPQTLGACYTGYVLWAVTPEGQAGNLGWLPQTEGHSREIEVTTRRQTFGLIVTAESHPLVIYPGPMIVAENILRKNTRRDLTAINIEYLGDPGIFYVTSGATGASTTADYDTPLNVLGARWAVEIARRAGAAVYASQELRDVESKLATMERIRLASRKKAEKFSAEAYEVMRLAEAARAKAVERAQQVQKKFRELSS
ncbi:MAG: DUF4398 domain-containing protein [Blastocatellales bacterium]